MITDREILLTLRVLVHPETGDDIVSMGLVQEIVVNEERVSFALALRKPGDPFANKFKRFATSLIEDEFPEYKGKVTVIIKEPQPVNKEVKKNHFATSNSKNLGRVIAISSCKGGVGKSTVVSNLAVTLANMGHRVGILDADVYGPSIPKMLGEENYRPSSHKVNEVEMMMPAERHGVKMMSMGFFINPTDALIWRGAMANNAIQQLVHQTDWGELDYLLIDLPPGTGDIHLSIFSELMIDGAIIVSTPQKVALDDVVRGIEMFRSESINVPILGIIENMSWFTPEELPNNKYYIFGKDGCKELAEVYNVPLLGEIPLVEGIRTGGDSGVPRVVTNDIIKDQFITVARAAMAELNVKQYAI